MYLKSIEMVGFKSFVNPTRLEFQPGMAAIIGPNGCGKSNIVDAIRWVLGEQSAKTLRGVKMEDFIFNGTDDRKALSMAEVSITFTECEGQLETEYDEVTVTRRVYRSGEGEYLLNKVPCRLRDIQRLFMNTGIGTASYSIMEQGRIDQILSSRPEDRRDVFEEASGITKFKTDRKEAIRKLEQTEANVLRLDDVIREVKRQIVSLQRQAGKARRYKELADELRRLDMFSTKERLEAFDRDIATAGGQMTSMVDQYEAAHADVVRIGGLNADLRSGLAGTEHEIESTVSGHSEAQMRLSRANDTITHNTERIAELRRMSEQETEEIRRAAGHVEQQRRELAHMLEELEKAKNEASTAEGRRRDKVDALTSYEADIEQVRKLTEDLASEYVGLESAFSSLQNDLQSMESGKRAETIRRERLAAERADTEREVRNYEERFAGMEKALAAMEKSALESQAKAEDLASRYVATRKSADEMIVRASGMESDVAVRSARLELLESYARTKPAMAVAGGEGVLGLLSQRIQAEAGYEVALQAVLSDWVEAAVVSDAAAGLRILEGLESGRQGPARLLVAGTGGQVSRIADGPGEALLSRVRFPGEIQSLAERLLGGVRVVDSVSSVPSEVPADAVYVTKSGSVVRGNGSMEFWMNSPESASHSMPLNVPELKTELNNAVLELTATREETRRLAAEAASLAESLDNARLELEDHRRKAAVKTGEKQVVAEELAETKERLATIGIEIEELDKANDSGSGKKQEVVQKMDEVASRRAEVKEQSEIRARELRAREQQMVVLSTEVMEARLRCSETTQKTDMLGRQFAPLQARLAELEESAERRQNDSVERDQHIARLASELEKASSEIGGLEEQVKASALKLEQVRQKRLGMEGEIAASDAELAKTRETCDALRDRKSQLEIKLAEATMRRQNLVDRVTTEYGITVDEVAKAVEPEWPDGRPERDWLDTQLAELRAKIDAMGPVNLVAIEEYQELEKRHDFLNQQRDDLVNSRRKLMTLINDINRTISTMFSETFAQVNANFDAIFKRLFNGGSAKLVLVNEEDVLECGIEIIARPPGKKLQSVGLLSGGERTLTALSLLFAIYMVKPSPFCVLDELDAPLDESNIGRFIKMVEGFVEQSQFLVITHNQQTMSAAEVLYGVTMEEKGVSKIVSMRFSEHHRKPKAWDSTADEKVVAHVEAVTDGDTAVATAIATEDVAVATAPEPAPEISVEPSVEASGEATPDDPAQQGAAGDTVTA